MGVKRGYKQTEVGVIPTKWTHQPLQSIGQWFSGSTPSMVNVAYWSGDIPWVSPKDMKVRRISDAQDHISSRAVADGARVLPPGAILIVIRGMILAHSLPVARTERPIAFNQDIKAVLTGADVDGQFLLYWLIANAHRLRSLTTESTHGTKRLPTEMLFRALVACPPLVEQEAIAEALSDADALTELLEQLVTKKRHTKQGAMQELLTGKRRLPGFEIKHGYKQTEAGVIPEDWEVKLAREFASIKTGPFGTLLKASEYSESDGVPLISVGEVREGFLQISAQTPRVAGAVTRRLPQYILRKGDIVFGRKGGVERSALIRKPQEGWFLGSDGIRVRPSQDFHADYLALQFQSKRVQGWLLQNAIGTTMPSLNQEILRNVAIPFPPTRAEQEAIAAILSDMDAEIVALEAKLAKSRQLKQGMMQELLTGRIRLI